METLEDVVVVRKGKLKARMLIIVLAFVWGSSFILMKEGLKVYPPGQVAGVRILSAFLFVFFIALPGLRKVKRSKFKYLFLSGMLGNLLPAFLFAFAQTKLNSSISGILNGLTPLFTLLIGALFFRSKITRNRALGIALGLVGSMGLSFMNAKGGLGGMNFYALLILLATIFYGINVNLLKKHFIDMSPLVVSSTALLLVGPLAGIYLGFTDFSEILKTDVSIHALKYILILGVVGTAISLILFNYLIQISDPVFASSVTYLIPFVALLWGFIDGEPITLFHVLGMGLILTGVYIVNRSK